MKKELSAQENLYLKWRYEWNYKIIKSLEDLGKLVDEITEAVKDEKKIQESGFLRALLAPLAASLLQPVISSVVKGISGRRVKRAGRG